MTQCGDVSTPLCFPDAACCESSDSASVFSTPEKKTRGHQAASKENTCPPNVQPPAHSAASSSSSKVQPPAKAPCVILFDVEEQSMHIGSPEASPPSVHIGSPEVYAECTPSPERTRVPSSPLPPLPVPLVLAGVAGGSPCVIGRVLPTVAVPGGARRVLGRHQTDPLPMSQAPGPTVLRLADSLFPCEAPQHWLVPVWVVPPCEVLRPQPSHDSMEHERAMSSQCDDLMPRVLFRDEA